MDREYLVGATPTVLYRFFQNFSGVLNMVWRYACGLDIILRLFLSLFSKLNLAIFQALYITKWIYRGNLVSATLLRQFHTDSFQTSLLFVSWSENMRVVWIVSSDYLFYYIILSLTFITFPAFYAFSAINILSMSIYICSTFECKCSYSFIQFFMKNLYVLLSWPEDMNNFR